MKRLHNFLLFLLCIVFHIYTASADIHTGNVEFRNDPGWDFSDSAYSDLYWDLNYGITKNIFNSTSQFVVLFGSCANCIMYSDSTYEELTTAPEDTSLYTSSLWALENQTYILRTRENHFVKFRVLVAGYPLVIEYTYQDDGSSTVPIDDITWGILKDVFR